MVPISGPPCRTKVRVYTEKVGEKLRLTMKLDGDEDRVEKDKDDYQPIERLRLDNVPHFEPTSSETHVQQSTGSIVNRYSN